MNRNVSELDDDNDQNSKRGTDTIVCILGPSSQLLLRTPRFNFASSAHQPEVCRRALSSPTSFRSMSTTRFKRWPPAVAAAVAVAQITGQSEHEAVGNCIPATFCSISRCHGNSRADSRSHACSGGIGGRGDLSV